VPLHSGLRGPEAGSGRPGGRLISGSAAEALQLARAAASCFAEHHHAQGGQEAAMSQRLFIGGKILDGGGAALDEHGLLVSGERVERLAPAAEFEGFSGERIELTGMTLLPGLID